MAADSLIVPILDTLFPPFCIGCGIHGDWMCEACASRLFIFTRARENQTPCMATLTVGPYADPLLQRLITSLKYQSASCLLPAWKRVLKTYRFSYLDPWPWVGLSALTVTSVPPDPDRLRMRGIDHASLIADVVQEVLVPWAIRETVLARVRPSMQNARLASDETRRANVDGVFAAITPIRQPVLLVDDVRTTGATSSEAARILLAHGAPIVYLLTMAEG